MSRGLPWKSESSTGVPSMPVAVKSYAEVMPLRYFPIKHLLGRIGEGSADHSPNRSVRMRVRSCPASTIH